MARHLAALTEQIDEDLWQWSVWVETNSPDEIKEVTYTLDPSFINPVRRTNENGTKFWITDVASGPFSIFARLKLISGSDVKLEIRLHLGKGSSSDARALPGDKPIIIVVDDDVSVLGQSSRICGGSMVPRLDWLERRLDNVD